ncbi:MAG: hypothetical protein M3M85_00520 [bacterium]|nr:hypothetical protein [bacterium]
MTLHEWSAWVSAVLVIVGCVWYAYLAIRGKTKPVLASWIVMSSTAVLSYATYWTSPKPSIASNASNAATVVGGMVVILVVGWLQRNTVLFDDDQLLCLKIAAAIFVFWIILVWGFRRTGIAPNVLTQFLMLIGHYITAKKLWRATKNTEPLFTWWCIMIASIIAIYSASDALAVLFAARATVTSAMLVWLMHRISQKNRAIPLLSVET